MISLTFYVFACVISVLAYYIFKSQKGRKLPEGSRPLPGPKGLPFVGRVHDVPSVATWLKFWEWSQEYGPIYQMEIFGSVHVWISDEGIANDLLAKRGMIYSDRPVIPNLPDNRTSGNYLALLGRTDTWKRQRKFAHQIMTKAAGDDNYDYPTLECKRFLYNMADDPSNYQMHVEEYTSRTISRLSWGSASHAQELRRGTFGLLQTISPSGAVPNVVSPLAHVPSWLSPWKKIENARHEREATFFRYTLNTVKDAVAGDTAVPSLMKIFLEGREKVGIKEEEAQYVVGMMAIAGALTIGSPIQSYILAMCHYPEWQAKMREEMRKVCGERCLEWEDREKMPLLRAVVKEVVRWRPPVPTGEFVVAAKSDRPESRIKKWGQLLTSIRSVLGIPHCLERDDVYNGYFIPAGATIHALEWGITRDPKTYPEPDSFRPDRWISPSFPTTYREPLTQYPSLKGFSQFGFGRRTCQGVDIVEQELFLTMGGMAWAFDIGRKKDSLGREIEVPLAKYTSLLIAKPEKFEFGLTPVSEERLRIVIEAYDNICDLEGESEEETSMGVEGEKSVLSC